MNQQFLPRSVRLRLCLFEASTCRVSGVIDSVSQRGPMAVDTDAEAASVAEYLRKHHLTETLAVFLKEAKREQQNGVIIPADIEVTAAAGKSSKKRKPGGEAKVPDPCVVESVFNALAAGIGEDKATSGISENGEKSTKKKRVKKDLKVDEKQADVVEWKGVFGKEGEEDATLKDATVDIAEVLPSTVEASGKEAGTPAKGQKKEKKSKQSQAALPESAIEKIETVESKGDGKDKTGDEKSTVELVQSEKPSKKSTRKGKKSVSEDVQAALENTQTSGGEAAGNAETTADKDTTSKEAPNEAVGVAAAEVGKNLQQVAPDGLTVKAKGKKGKKDMGAAPGETVQAEGENGNGKAVLGGATTRSRGKKLKEAVADAGKVKLSEVATGADAERLTHGEFATDAQKIGAPSGERKDDSVKESDKPKAAELAKNEGTKPGKGKKDKKVRASDVDNGSSEKDAGAAEVGSLKPQEDVEMISADDPKASEEVDVDVGKKKKISTKIKKGKVPDDAQEKDAASGLGTAQAERDAVDTTNLKSHEGEATKEIHTKDQEQNGQQPSADATPSKKKGKKSKDRGGEAPPEAADDGKETAVEDNTGEAIPANGAEVTGKKKRKRNEVDDVPETAGENGSVADDPSPAVPSKKAKKGDMKTSNTAPKPFFQRVDPSKVEILDPRLQDNSYWSKDGADNGWGAKAEEVLGKVRGKDFRHEKTKKKRGTYKGGPIDLQSHSVKFNYPDDD